MSLFCQPYTILHFDTDTWFYSNPISVFAGQVKVDSMARAYQPRRHSLRPQPSVGVAEMLAAREDICNVVKTSSGSRREHTACAVNKVLLSLVLQTLTGRWDKDYILLTLDTSDTYNLYSQIYMNRQANDSAPVKNVVLKSGKCRCG